MLGHGATGQFAIGEFATTQGTAEAITVDKWFQPLSEPVRFRGGLMAAQQQFLAQADPFPFVSFSWFEELSIPALRTAPQLSAAQQQFFAFQPMPSPFVATGWFMPLSEPVRSKPGLLAGQQQALAYQGDAITLTPFAWFMSLSEPVRKRAALNPGQNQAFAIDTAVIPITKMSPWFAPLSEPVRKLAGLDAARQQFLAAPSRLMPNPNVSGTLRAFESGDLFTGGGREWNRVISGEVGTIEKRFTGAEVSAAVTVPSVGTSGLVAQQAAPVSGAATPVISKASVAVTIK